MAYNDNKMNYVEPSNYESATEPKPEENDEGWIGVILEYVSILVALPLFLLLSKVLPDPDWVINLDRILLFILTFIVIYFVLKIIPLINKINNQIHNNYRIVRRNRFSDIRKSCFRRPLWVEKCCF